MPTSRLLPQDRASSLLAAAAARSRAEAVTLQGEKFPHALRRLSPPRAHLAAHLHPAAGACSRRRAEAGAPGSQIITLKSPRTLACADVPRLHQALPPCSSAPSAPAQSEPPTRPPPPPPQCPPRALRDWSRGQRRSAFGGLAGGGGDREEGSGSGRRGTGREIPIRSPDHSAACREQRRLSSRLRAAAAAAATARRLAAPSSPSRPTPTHSQAPLSSPPLAFLSLSPPPKPRAKRARGRGASASGLTRDLGAPRGGERRGGGRGGGCERGAASRRALSAPGLEAGLILELESPRTSLSGLEENTSVPSCPPGAWCRLRGARTPLSARPVAQAGSSRELTLLSEGR